MNRTIQFFGLLNLILKIEFFSRKNAFVTIENRLRMNTKSEFTYWRARIEHRISDLFVYTSPPCRRSKCQWCGARSHCIQTVTFLRFFVFLSLLCRCCSRYRLRCCRRRRRCCCYYYYDKIKYGVVIAMKCSDTVHLCFLCRSQIYWVNSEHFE